MNLHPLRKPLFAFTFVLLSAAGSAQWLTEKTPGIPRTSGGKPNLAAPAPRTSDGKPDLSGLWQTGTKYDSDFRSADAQPWARERTRQREATPTSDSWSTLCLPPGPMITFSGPLKIVQTPRLVTVLYEVPNNFRQIFMDGRSLPKDPSPTWQGYSVGRWDGDALIVETIGFNDGSFVGRPSTPHTEALHITERYRRRDFGHIDLRMTVDDPRAFTRTWTIDTELVFQPDTELLEYVCTENEKDRQHIVQSQSISSNEVRTDPAVLAKYAGVYEVMTPRGPSKATMTVEGDQLMVDLPGIGRGRMVPRSATSFSFSGALVEFVTNENGEVTHLIAHAVEGDFKGPKVQ